MAVNAEVRHGDCLDVLPTLPAESADAGVSDPPYGFAFMGKAWDHGVPGVPFWEATRRVLKPGAYLVAFGGPRTFHRLACHIEDAGFEIQDTLSWLFAQGFPKHKSKLKPAWEPIILARKPAPKATPLNIDACRLGTDDDTSRANNGTALGLMNDDGWQPRAMTTAGHAAGRWPANVVLSHADECVPMGTRRVRGVQRAAGSPGFGADRDDGYALGTGREYAPDEERERWACVPECPVRLLDAQSGERTSGGRPGAKYASQHAEYDGWGNVGTAGSGVCHGDTGGASRFFYCAKASRAEREAGLDGFPVKACGTMEDDAYEWKGTDTHAPHSTRRRNGHPTVKPLSLMRWLVRLVTPTNGTVLDPFTGSGTTGCAAVLEGRRFLGIEKEEEYATIARARIAHHTPAAPAQASLPLDAA